MSSIDTDILIVGGGLVGASLACALAPLGYQVTLLEAARPRTASPPSYDDRTLALGRASCLILRALGLWSSLVENATPIRQVSVTELGRPGRVLMDAQELGLDYFGNVIEAREFGQAVMQQVDTLQGLGMLCPFRAESLETLDHAVRVTAQGESGGEAEVRQITARLVVGADGADSDVRKLLGIGADIHDYGQVAIIANVMPEVAHDGRAFERMTPTGPFALLPHVAGRCGLVWCVPEAEAPALLEMAEDEFLAAATLRSGGVLGQLGRLGQRSSYPLRRVVPETDTAQRVVLLGNAAHAIHPVGAQGFNLGLRDVAVLGEVLADACLAGGERADPGQAAVLERYSQWRRPDQSSTVGWSHDMVNLFASALPLTRQARSLGLALVGMTPLMRRRMALRAMGYRGQTPRLALGEPLLNPLFTDWATGI